MQDCLLIFVINSHNTPLDTSKSRQLRAHSMHPRTSLHMPLQRDDFIRRNQCTQPQSSTRTGQTCWKHNLNSCQRLHC
jgi:hypothetical protein